MTSNYPAVLRWRQKHRKKYNQYERLRKKLKRSRWWWLAVSKADPHTDAHKHR